MLAIIMCVALGAACPQMSDQELPDPTPAPNHRDSHRAVLPDPGGLARHAALPVPAGSGRQVRQTA